MSHFFYDFETLESGTKDMVDSLKRMYEGMSVRKVSPSVEPGFLRSQLSENPSEEGKSMK